MGLEIGAGVSVFSAMHSNSLEVSAKSWEGKFSGFMGGVGSLFGDYFWANDKDRVALLPGISNRKTIWEGIFVGTATTVGYYIGAEWYFSDYKHRGKL